MNGSWNPPPSGGWYQNNGGMNRFPWQWQQQRKLHAKGIRRTANAVGLGMLLIEALGGVLAVILSVVLGILFPGAAQSGSVYYEALEYAVYAPIAMGVPFIIAAKFAYRSPGSLVTFHKHSPILSAGCVMFGFLFVAMGNFVSAIVATMFPQVEQNVSAMMGADPTNGLELFVYVLYIAAIPALIEEFAFRGITLGLLRPYGDGFAIVVSALAFGLIHGNFLQFPFTFVLGLGLGYAVVRTGSLVPAILIHFFNNATSCLITYFEPYLANALGDAYILGVYMMWLFLGGLGYLILRVGYGQPLTRCFKPYAGLLTPSGRTGAFFTGVLWLAAVGVYLLLSFWMAVPK